MHRLPIPPRGFVLIVNFLSGRRIPGDSAQRSENRVPLFASLRRGDRQRRSIDGVRTIGCSDSQGRVRTTVGASLLGSVSLFVIPV